MTRESAAPEMRSTDAGPGGGDRPSARPSTPVPGGSGPRGLLAHLRHLVVGFLMGSAEVVPGVSGGTVALVGGIYSRLIEAVRDGVDAAVTVVRGQVRPGIERIRRLDWALLIPLGVGMVVAVLSLARVVEHYLEEEPVRIGGLFLGLVLGSVLVAFRLVKRFDTTAVLIALGVGVVLFLLLGLRQETTGPESEIATAPLWAYPLAASVAICAWILPGVSGSLMLVMMGMYADVFGAVNDRDLLPLLLFAVGAVIGLGLFSKALSWLMAHHHDRMVAAMIGLMLGSTRVLWPWPGGVDSTELAAPAGDVGMPVALAVVGFVAMLALARLGVIHEDEGGEGDDTAPEVGPEPAPAR